MRKVSGSDGAASSGATSTSADPGKAWADPVAVGANPVGARALAPTRARFGHFTSITTRWMDNDIYGHVNNIVYYGYFDTVVNRYLIECGVLDIHRGVVIGLVVESGCRYFAPLAFPQTLVGGLRVARLGKSSVRYEVGVFAQDSDEAAAHGHFVHVYVDRTTRRPVPLPASLRAALELLVI